MSRALEHAVMVAVRRHLLTPPATPPSIKSLLRLYQGSIKALLRVY